MTTIQWTDLVKQIAESANQAGLYAHFTRNTARPGIINARLGLRDDVAQQTPQQPHIAIGFDTQTGRWGIETLTHTSLPPLQGPWAFESDPDTQQEGNSMSLFKTVVFNQADQLRAQLINPVQLPPVPSEAQLRAAIARVSHAITSKDQPQTIAVNAPDEHIALQGYENGNVTILTETRDPLIVSHTYPIAEVDHVATDIEKFGNSTRRPKHLRIEAEGTDPDNWRMKPSGTTSANEIARNITELARETDQSISLYDGTRELHVYRSVDDMADMEADPYWETTELDRTRFTKRSEEIIYSPARPLVERRLSELANRARDKITGEQQHIDVHGLPLTNIGSMPNQAGSNAHTFIRQVQ